MRTLLGLMLVFVLGTGVASAARLDPNQAQLEGGPAIVPITSIHGDANVRGSVNGGSGEVHTEGRFGLQRVNPEAQHGSATSTPSHDTEDVRTVMKEFLLKHSVPGLVTSVSSDSFVMTVPAGKDHATTSVTVNVSSSTKFWHASSTAALSDITAGTRVAVFGKTSSTTQSVAAERVIIGANSDDLSQPKKNLLERVKNFFTGKHATTTEKMIEIRGGAAASMGGGVSGFLHKLFGWFK